MCIVCSQQPALIVPPLSGETVSCFWIFLRFRLPQVTSHSWKCVSWSLPHAGCSCELSQTENTSLQAVASYSFTSLCHDSVLYQLRIRKKVFDTNTILCVDVLIIGIFKASGFFLSPCFNLIPLHGNVYTKASLNDMTIVSVWITLFLPVSFIVLFLVSEHSNHDPSSWQSSGSSHLQLLGHQTGQCLRAGKTVLWWVWLTPSDRHTLHLVSPRATVCPSSTSCGGCSWSPEDDSLLLWWLSTWHYPFIAPSDHSFSWTSTFSHGKGVQKLRLNLQSVCSVFSRSP